MKNMRTMRFTRTALKNLFSPPVTRPYPEQPREYPERTRGHVEIDIDTCILCGLCSRKCPTGAITVNRAEKTWKIERFGCIQCGCCVETCPKKCLTMKKYLYPARGGEDRGFLPENQYARSGREACGPCSKTAGGSGGESGGDPVRSQKRRLLSERRKHEGADHRPRRGAGRGLPSPLWRSVPARFLFGEACATAAAW